MAALFSTLRSSPETYSTFDIGTGKIKMQVARVHKEHIESLHCKSELISIPNTPILDQEGRISREGQDRIVAILRSLKVSGEGYGSTKCEAIATELFRKAPNGREVAQNISDLLDMEIRIISPEEEGILSFLTIVQETASDPENIVVLDIGSGSFQITCKVENHFLVYSAPFGRLPTHELIKTDRLSSLKTKLRGIDPRIAVKIRACQNKVIGTGAHPKHILHSKTTYDADDLKAALLAHPEIDLDHTDLLLVQTLMELLPITQIHYLASRAGNTTGVFALQTQL